MTKASTFDVPVVGVEHGAHVLPRLLQPARARGRREARLGVVRRGARAAGRSERRWRWRAAAAGGGWAAARGGRRLREDVRAAPLARKVGALAVVLVVVEVPAAVERVPLLRRLVEGRRRSPHRRSKPRSWSSCRGRRGSAPRVGAGARRRGRLAAAVRARARACAGAARERAGGGSARARGGQARRLLQPVLHARAVELVAKVVTTKSPEKSVTPEGTLSRRVASSCEHFCRRRLLAPLCPYSAHG